MKTQEEIETRMMEISNRADDAENPKRAELLAQEYILQWVLEE